MTLETITGTVFAAVIFSLSAYLKKSQKPPHIPKDNFNMEKLIATAIYGGFIGVVAVLLGVEMTEEFFAVQSAGYGMVAICIQNLVSSGFRWLNNKYIIF